jgi:hypothetical protein
MTLPWGGRWVVYSQIAIYFIHFTTIYHIHVAYTSRASYQLRVRPRELGDIVLFLLFPRSSSYRCGPSRRLGDSWSPARFFGHSEHVFAAGRSGHSRFPPGFSVRSGHAVAAVRTGPVLQTRRRDENETGRAPSRNTENDREASRRHEKCRDKARISAKKNIRWETQV